MNTIKILAFLMISTLLMGQESPQIIYGNYANSNSIHQNALNKYTTIIDNNPQDVETLLKRSELHMLLGDDTAAQRDIRQANAINPYAKIYFNPAYRGHLFTIKDYTYLGDHVEEESSKFYESFVLYEEYLNYMNGDSLSLDNVNFMSNVIGSVINRDYDDAQLYLDEVTDSLQHSALYYDLKGVLLLKQNKLPEALEALSTAISLNPKFITPYHNRAIAYKKLGDFNAAEQDFKMALRLNSDIAKVHFGSAKLSQLQGNLKEAKSSYRIASSKEEYSSVAMANYSSILKATGDYRGAMQNINLVIDESPEIIENYYIRGGIYFIYGEYENAIDDFDKYISTNSKDNEAWFYRGLSKVLNKDVYEGCKDLNESLERGYDQENKDIIFYVCTNKSHR